MASSSTTATGAAAAALLFAVLAVLSSPASARPGIPFHPCNTLFITYTVSTTTTTTGAEDTSAPRRTTGFVSIYRIITPFRPSVAADVDGRHHRPLMMLRPSHMVVPRRAEVARPADEPAFGFSSLEERAKDILVVVVGLLFGVGCGALTAATMYLVWSLVSNRHEMCGGAYDDEDEEFEDVDKLKKAGYIKIPAAEPTAATAKEGYEGN